MEITKQEAEALLAYFSNQFIDLNSKKLYDGLVIKILLGKLKNFVYEPEES